ncbi:MAG TPA: carboxymuconolactone decarboxylase family protein [Patescibacteria group bacterium]|nr:carboxymuconolactone decarboxylase family protein [Patescibacteria group bacterium]
MARIELVKPENMTPAEKVIYQRFPSNIVRGLLKTKNCAPAYAALGSSLRNLFLTPKDTEFVIIRVAYMSNSQYELMQHRHLALRQGWREEDIAAIAENNLEYFERRMQTILNYVNECVERVKVSRTVFAAAREYLSESEIAELTLLIGHYMLTARFLESLEIDLDEKPTSWDNVQLTTDR